MRQKESPQRSIRAKKNLIVIGLDHPDARHIKVTFKGKPVIATEVCLYVRDGQYVSVERRQVDVGFELKETTKDVPNKRKWRALLPNWMKPSRRK